MRPALSPVSVCLSVGVSNYSKTYERISDRNFWRGGPRNNGLDFGDDPEHDPDLHLRINSRSECLCSPSASVFLLVPTSHLFHRYKYTDCLYRCKCT